MGDDSIKLLFFIFMWFRVYYWWLDYLSLTPSPNVREKPFAIMIQVKKDVVGVIFNISYQKNLISTSLVKKFSLEMISHLCSYPLRWFHDDVEVKINQCCKMCFIITKEFINEITCEVVLLDICQIILGSPYLWD